MTKLRGFPPILSPQAKVLILGSIPGCESLARQAYYAHPRNVFWRIVQDLLGIDCGWPYARRVKTLQERGIVLWDVLHSCEREGSLDAAIVEGSVEVNAFVPLYRRYPGIRRVFFNGGKAESLYRRRVLPDLRTEFEYLDYCRLPSTSPANAAWSYARKLEAWRAIVIGVSDCSENRLSHD